MFVTALASGVAIAGAGALGGFALEKHGIPGLNFLVENPTPTPSSIVTGEANTVRPQPSDGAQPASFIYGNFKVPNLHRVAPPHGEIDSVPGNRGLLALTVDDGASAATIKGYCDFVERTGFRMTFFVTSMYDSWLENKAQLRRLIESGHVQLANHTTTHEWLTRIPDSEIAAQLTGCERFLRNNFGVTGHPYFRPPYGAADDRVLRVAANEGYTTAVYWYGSFGDAGKRTTKRIKELANQWLKKDHIVIGHANFTPVLSCLDYIESLLHERGLQPVTLDDYYDRGFSKNV